MKKYIKRHENMADRQASAGHQSRQKQGREEMEAERQRDGEAEMKA
jgi:hypothetical protein